MAQRKHVSRGLSPRDAARTARKHFGSVAVVEDLARDQRGIGAFDRSVQDVRYALRGFRRAPTFTATVVGTIALGLGLNTAVFTIFNAYVLKPVAVRDPHSLYEVQWQSRAGAWHRLSWAQFGQFRRDTRVFSDVIAERRLVALIDGHTSYAALVSGNYFDMLGVRADLGRTLLPADTAAPGGPPIAVLSRALWQRQFGSDPAIVGRRILVQGVPCEVVGVAREGFAGLDLLPPHDLWLPITLQGRLEDGPGLFAPDSPRQVTVIGRLRTDVTRGAAEAASLVWARNLTRSLPDDQKASAVLLESKATSIPLSPMVMLAASPIICGFGLVLVIACANVANMMFARSLARQREIGIRLTLGASRARLVRQLLTESVLLSIPAAALGYVLSRAALDAGVRALFSTLPSEFTEFMRIAPLPPDARVFLFMIGAAVTCGVGFGLAPALQSTRSDVVQVARGEFQPNVGPSRLRSALVVLQLTASVLLLITAAILIRAAQRFSSINPGLETRGVITLDVRDSSRARVVATLEQLPAVVAVASASTIPLDANAPLVMVHTERSAEPVAAHYRYVSSEYFPIFDVRLVDGRRFTKAEGDAGVTVISESLARRLWPDRSAVGQALQIVPDGRVPATAPIRRQTTLQVVGVTADAPVDLNAAGPDALVLQLPASVTAAGAGLVVRVSDEPQGARQAIRAALDAATPGAVQTIHKLDEFVAGRVYPFRVAYWIAGMVGALALVLTISGVYGVLSYIGAAPARARHSYGARRGFQGGRDARAHACAPASRRRRAHRRTAGTGRCASVRCERDDGRRLRRTELRGRNARRGRSVRRRITCACRAGDANRSGEHAARRVTNAYFSSLPSAFHSSCSFRSSAWCSSMNLTFACCASVSFASSTFMPDF
jgi:predicted permease